MIVGEGEIHINKYLYLVLMKNQFGNAKECKNLIRKGYVQVNGKYVKDFHYTVQKEDYITVNGQKINATPFIYLMINKPSGYLCATHDAHNPCILEFVDCKDCYCVGRLDKDTTGFVLLTNDKSLSKKLLLPSHHVEKIYEVRTKYPLTENDIYKFQEGIIIDKDVRCLPADLEIIDDYHCLVTLKEGKYHQIKKMFLSLSNQVVFLKRISFANIILDKQLQYGEYRPLNDYEMNILQQVLKETE